LAFHKKSTLSLSQKRGKRTSSGSLFFLSFFIFDLIC
jgi:hypothetical protein